MSLAEWYSIQLILLDERRWDMDYIKGLIPWERDILLNMLQEKLSED